MIFDIYKGGFKLFFLNLWDFEKIITKNYQISTICSSWCLFLCKISHCCELFLWVFWVSFTRCLLLVAVGIKGFFLTCSTNKLPFIAKSPSWDACYWHSSKKLKKKKKKPSCKLNFVLALCSSQGSGSKLKCHNCSVPSYYTCTYNLHWWDNWVKNCLVIHGFLVSVWTISFFWDPLIKSTW